MKAPASLPASPEAALQTPGDYARQIGRELLAAHDRLEAARLLLLSWRARACDESWQAKLPPEASQ